MVYRPSDKSPISTRLLSTAGHTYDALLGLDVVHSPNGADREGDTASKENVGGAGHCEWTVVKQAGCAQGGGYAERLTREG